MTKVLLVDDHPLLRAGIRQILTATSEFLVVGEAGRARDAFVLIDAEEPDVVLMDVALPGMDGVIATREIRRRAARTRVLILTVHDQITDVLDALNAGATGYALKTDDTETLLEALRTVAKGDRYLAPAIAARLESYESRRRKASDVLSVLSVREREVFRLAAECLITREIAHELCISRKTVDTHLYRIHRKLGLRTSAELVRLASSLGLVHAGRTRESVVQLAAMEGVEAVAAVEPPRQNRWQAWPRRGEIVSRRGPGRAPVDVTALVAHELTGPVANAMLYLRIAECHCASGSAPNPAARSAVRVACAELDRLKHLIDRVVEIERFGGALVRPESIDLGAVVRGVVERTLAVVADASLREGVEVLGPASFVGWWDPIAVEQIIRNLLSNALKFGEGRPIQVTLESKAEGATITVQDAGVGIRTRGRGANLRQTDPRPRVAGRRARDWGYGSFASWPPPTGALSASRLATERARLSGCACRSWGPRPSSARLCRRFGTKSRCFDHP